MKNKLHSLGLLVMLSFFVLSCGSEDEEPADPRDEAMGTYNYTVNYSC